MKRNNLNILLATFLILLTITARIVNASLHIPNIVPIAAISVFGGAIIKDKRIAFLVPLLGQFLADVYFQFFTTTPGFYDLAGMLFNYGGLIAATGIGMTMKQPKPLTTIACILGGSVGFFLVSNFGYFVHGWNGYSVAGLTKTYIDAIPFFKSSFAADVVGGVLLFGGYFLMEKRLTDSAEKVKA